MEYHIISVTFNLQSFKKHLGYVSNKLVKSEG